MIFFAFVVAILVWKYRYVPVDVYSNWKRERDFVNESLRPGAGMDYHPPRPKLTLVK